MYGILAAQLALGLALIVFVLQPLVLYLYDSKRLRRFPSVSVAAFTNSWAVIQQYRHSRTIAVHKAHLHHGRMIRVGPTHVSFATTAAIKDMYGHGTKATKDGFYNAFVSTHLNISDARDKNVHNLKRKRFAQAFAQKSIVELEGVMRGHLERMMRYIEENRGTSEIPEIFDMKHVILSTLYDANCVTLFNQDPRFLERNSLVTTAETISGKRYDANLYEALTRSSHAATSIGWAPDSMGWLKKMTWWYPGWKSGTELRDITIHLLRNRLRLDTERIRAGGKPLDDFLTTMLWDRDSNALCLEFGELVTEASNLFSAAGENTEIATTNIVWLLARNPRVAERLREELDEVLGPEKGAIPTYESIKDLSYLRACIDEGLRLRPSIEGGLPRVVPKGGLSVSGEWLEEGTTISVSTHTIHRDPDVFGELSDEYIPERWLRPESAEMQRGFLAFSQGGRGCIGRNIAYFEMQLIVATLFRRYNLSLPSPMWELPIKEAFSAHTLAMPMRLTPRSRHLGHDQ